MSVFERAKRACVEWTCEIKVDMNGGLRVSLKYDSVIIIQILERILKKFTEIY